MEPLTPRERAVLDLLADGRTNVEIAAELGISWVAARNLVRAILGKLGVETREEAATWWRAYGASAPVRRQQVQAERRREWPSLPRARYLFAGSAGAIALAGIAMLAILLWRVDWERVPVEQADPATPTPAAASAASPVASHVAGEATDPEEFAAFLDLLDDGLRAGDVDFLLDRLMMDRLTCREVGGALPGPCTRAAEALDVFALGSDYSSQQGTALLTLPDMRAYFEALLNDPGDKPLFAYAWYPVGGSARSGIYAALVGGPDSEGSPILATAWERHGGRWRLTFVQEQESWASPALDPTLAVATRDWGRLSSGGPPPVREYPTEEAFASFALDIETALLQGNPVPLASRLVPWHLRCPESAPGCNSDVVPLGDEAGGRLASTGEAMTIVQALIDGQVADVADDYGDGVLRVQAFTYDAAHGEGRMALTAIVARDGQPARSAVELSWRWIGDGWGLTALDTRFERPADLLDQPEEGPIWQLLE